MKSCFRLIALAAPAVLPAVAFAQAEASPASLPDTGKVGLEEIVVTAQRREERQQRVPIAVTSVGSSALASAGIQNALDLPKLVPGLTISNDTGYSLIYLRGLGSDLVGPGVEPSVATYVDGVYIAAQTGTLLALNNVARVEVLKGPQGTLFGRNASGGVIQIITRDPSHDTHIDASYGFSRFNTSDANFYGTTGITPTLAVDLAAYYHDQAKGYGYDPTIDRRIYRNRELSLRSKILWTPAAETKVTLALDYSYARGDTGLMWRSLPGATALDGGGYTGFYTARGDQDYVRQRQRGVMLKVEQDLGAVRLLSISAYRSLSYREVFDQDGTPLRIVDARWTQPTKTFSQELQLQSGSGSRLQWIVGAYFFDAKTHYPFTLEGASAAPLTTLAIDYRSHTIYYAGFAQATLPIAEDTRLTAGVRYTHDRQEADGAISGDGALIISGSPSKNFQKVTYRASVDHQFTPDTMAYLSYNRGFKSGLFNQSTFYLPPVKPEVLDAYELGVKSTVFDHRLRLNPSIFFYDYRNIQVVNFANGTVSFQNAGAAHIYGLDFDGAFAVTRRLQLSGGFAYLHGRYTRFPVANVYVPDASAANTLVAIDAKGKTTIHTPTFSANATLTYSVPLSSGGLEFSANYSYSDRYFWDVNNRIAQPRTHIVNTSVTWSNAAKSRDVKAWVRNLTDQKYYVFEVGGGTGDLGAPALPRTYGMTVGVHF